MAREVRPFFFLKQQMSDVSCIADLKCTCLTLRLPMLCTQVTSSRVPSLQFSAFMVCISHDAVNVLVNCIACFSHELFATDKLERKHKRLKKVPVLSSRSSSKLLVRQSLSVNGVEVWAPEGHAEPDVGVHSKFCQTVGENIMRFEVVDPPGGTEVFQIML